MPSHKSLDVRRVRSSLVATFSKANPPLVWRLDLDRNHSFTVALQDHDGEWELGTTSPKGEFHSIARFPLKEDAEEAMQRVGEVLAESRLGWIWGFIKKLGLALLVFFLVLWGWSIIGRLMAPAPQPPQLVAIPPPPPEQTPAPPPSSEPPAATQNGIPLPADDVLKPPPN